MAKFQANLSENFGKEFKKIKSEISLVFIKENPSNFCLK